MSKGNFIVDEYLRIKEKRTSFLDILKKFLLYLFGSISLAILYYIVGALFLSSDTDRKLKKENRMFAEQYPAMVEKERLLADVVEGLDLRDERIYKEIFRSEAPTAYKLQKMDFLNINDSVRNTDIVAASVRKMESIVDKTSKIEDNFRKAYTILEQKGFCPPPMIMPLDNFTYAKTGASVGMKVSPFYNVPAVHNGIDLLAPTGSPVKAAAEGMVTQIIHSRKGLGNVVEISHRNGYRTRYAHLGDIKVSKGRMVKAGEVLGSVGMSGNTFAPHLHYEVWCGDKVLDPVGHLFAGISPQDYANMVLMAASSGKSMD